MFSRLKKLVLTRNPDRLREGIEQLRSLDDAELFEEFLSGCELVDMPLDSRDHLRLLLYEFGPPPKAYDNITPNDVLAHGSLTRPFRQAAIRALVAYAPPDSATGARLRSSVRSLYCEGQGSGRIKQPVDVAPLAEFPNLETLALENISELTSRPALAGAARLSTLVLCHVGGDLDGLSSPTVTTLRLAQYLEGGPHLAGFPALRRLVTSGSAGFPDLSDTAWCLPELTEVALCSDAAATLVPVIARSPLERLALKVWHLSDRRSLARLTPLADTPTLTELQVTGVGSADLTPLRELRSLRSVQLAQVHEDADLSVLGKLPNLVDLSFMSSRLGAATVRAIAEAPALQRLRLRNFTSVEGEMPPRLQKIVERIG